MKIPLRFQNTEYDCGTTSFVNALAYLFDREDIPVELLKAIYRYTLDVDNGYGGTSRESANALIDKFMEYASSNDFKIKCTKLEKEDVTLDNIKKILLNGVVVARSIQEVEHYVLITKIDDNFAYIFDPYYLSEDYYVNDDDVAVVLNELFTHNRLVKIERLMEESNRDFSLMEIEKRQIIGIEKIDG